MLVTFVRMGVGDLGSLLLQKVGVREGGKSGGFVNDGSLVHLFVDTDSVVDGGGLDSLALDDGLD